MTAVIVSPTFFRHVQSGNGCLLWVVQQRLTSLIRPFTQGYVRRWLAQISNVISSEWKSYSSRKWMQNICVITGRMDLKTYGIKFFLSFFRIFALGVPKKVLSILLLSIAL